MSEQLLLEFQKPFDAEKYKLFLKAKVLPEKQLRYCWKNDKYILITNGRYARDLGLEVGEYNATDLPISEFLFDYQKFIVRQALESKRYAIYADCLLPGSLIKTQAGYKEIENVCNDKLYCMCGYSDIDARKKKHYKGDVVDVTTRCGFDSIAATENHEFYVVRFRKCKTHNKLCTQNCFIQCKTKYYEEYSVEKVQAKDLKRTDCLLYLPKTGNKTISSAWLTVAGYYLSEGYIKKQKGKGYGVGFAFSAEEEHTKAKECFDSLKQLGYDPKTRFHNKRKTVFLVEVNNRKIAEKIISDFGTHSDKKTIPEYISELTDNNKIIFLKALFNGDGHIKTNAYMYEKDTQLMRYTTVSKQLALAVRDLLLDIGIVPSCWKENAKIDKKGQRHKTAYRILINRDGMRKFGFAFCRKRRNLKQYKFGDYMLIPVQDIITRQYKGDVYNFTVSRHDSYMTEIGMSKNCGLGKTAMFLEFARHVLHKTGGKMLILSPLQIIPQTIEESNRFYGISPIQLRTREDLLAWLADSDHAERFAITNYEKLIEGVTPELNGLAGLICDESSILKTGGGVIKWNLVKSVKGIEYKLSCTATPAPNDIMEYASQASFLGKLRSDGEIMWTYFNRDKHGNWGIKPYAREGFYRFLSSWSIYIRNPAHYGFTDNLSSIPAPEFHTIEIEETPEQKEEELKIRRTKSENMMFGDLEVGIAKRTKLSQVAKGFMYNKDKTITRIPSLKPGIVADIVSKAVNEGRQVLVWTVFDEEGEILLENLRLGMSAKILSGKTSEEKRLEIIEDFRHGKISVLISKPSLLGFGLNFQFCSAMVFSGWDDSFERFYQALKRAHRFGQTKALQVYLPVIKNLEGAILENVIKKKGNFEADAMKHEEIYKKILLETE